MKKTPLNWLRYVSVFGFRSLLSKLIISYFVILVAVLAFGLLALKKVGGVISRREQQASQQSLDRAFEQVDVELAHLVAAAHGVLLTNENMRKLADSETSIYPRLQLMSDLARFRSTFPLVSEVYLSKAGLRFVIGCDGTEADRQPFDALVNPPDGMRASIANVRETSGFSVLAAAQRSASDSAGKDWLVLVAGRGALASAATLYVFIDERNLRNALARGTVSDYGRLSVIDSRGRVLTASDGQGVGGNVDAGLRAAFDRAGRRTTFDHEGSLVVFRRSLFFDGFYFAQIPYATLLQPLAIVRAWFWIAGICLLVLQVVVSVGFAVLIYKPVAGLVDEVAENRPAGRSPGNELTMVKDAMHNIQAETRSLAERTAIEDLLESGEPSSAFVKLFPLPLFKAIVLKAADAREACLITRDFLATHGAPAPRWACAMSGHPGECTVVVNATTIDDDRVRSSFEQLVEVGAAAGCRLFVGVGPTVAGAEHVEESLRAAIDALSQGASGSRGGVHYSDDASRDSSRLYFPTNVESLLAAAIAGANPARVAAIVRDVFRRNERVPNLYVTMIGRELLNVYLRLRRSSGPDPRLEAVNRMVESDLAVDRFEQAFVELFTALIHLQPQPGRKQQHLVDLVMRLVEQKYMRPDLCGQAIAGHVGLSAPHLSSVFKREVGIGLADYLAAYRFERAKELLLATNRSVKEIAHGVGFAVENSFVRAFRKRMGMSPGEYRRQSHTTREMRAPQLQ